MLIWFEVLSFPWIINWLNFTEIKSHNSCKCLKTQFRCKAQTLNMKLPIFVPVNLVNLSREAHQVIPFSFMSDSIRLQKLHFPFPYTQSKRWQVTIHFAGGSLFAKFRFRCTSFPWRCSKFHIFLYFVLFGCSFFQDINFHASTCSYYFSVLQNLF